MRLILIISILQVMAASGYAQFSDKRRLYIFGTQANEILAKKQQHLLDSAKSGMDERDILITDEDHNKVLIAKYHIDNKRFTLILIGKDGGEKYRSHSIVTPQKLFSIIDAMPMRRAEMRRSNK